MDQNEEKPINTYQFRKSEKQRSKKKEKRKKRNQSEGSRKRKAEQRSEWIESILKTKRCENNVKRKKQGIGKKSKQTTGSRE